MNTTLIDDEPGYTEPARHARASVDRRVRVSPWYLFRGGRRKAVRRAGDASRPRDIDRLRWPVVGVALALVGFSAFDAFATIQLLSMGCEEANPVMLQLLRLGTLVFMIGKFGLTIAGVSVLLGFRYHALFSSPLRVGHFLLGLGGVYLALVVYELVLLGTLSTA